jgi:hypothetical protein
LAELADWAGYKNNVCIGTIDIERRKIDCSSFVMCPLQALLIIGFSSYFFLLWTVLMKQTRQAVRAIKQSIFLDVYDWNMCQDTIDI